MEVRGEYCRVNVIVVKSYLSLIHRVKMPSYASSVYILRCQYFNFFQSLLYV
jgi:hypothetical protein